MFRYIYSLFQKPCVVLWMMLCFSIQTLANDKQPIELTLSTETAQGSGNFSPYYLVSNRNGILDRNAHTGYMRADLIWHQQVGTWQLEAAADLQIAAHANQSWYVQQLYASATWRWLNLSLGSREEKPLLRDQELSSGSTVWSGNCRPIPQIKIGTNGFVNIPYTHGWLQAYLDISYGRYLDDDYQESEFARYIADKSGYGRSWITTDVWSHQKRIAFRSHPQKPWVVTLGMEHAVQFGGHTRNFINPMMADVAYHPTLKDFFKVLWPSGGDSNSAPGDQSFVYGNHIGNINAMVQYQWGQQQSHRVGAYVENLFDDGSGMRKGNGWDGLWGLEYHRRNGHSWLNGLVVEYLQTTDQSGPIHWSPHDFSGKDVIELIANDATGADDYYNNYFYTGYTHYGMCCGSPMLKSPAFNTDHYLRFTDTRVMAWHVGINGEIWRASEKDNASCLTYRGLLSTRRSWGTYEAPSMQVNDATCGLLELTYKQTRWNLTVSYAFDEGNLYGNNHAMGLRFGYRVF